MSTRDTDLEREALAKQFGIPTSPFYFPVESFLEVGYAPPGGYVKDFGVIWHQGRLHLFHIDGRPEERCVESGNEISFGHASTIDLQHWIRHRMPLAVGDSPWDNAHVWAPFVIKHDKLFYMFYMAAGRGVSGNIAIATSFDLETWIKHPIGTVKGAIGRDPFVHIVDDDAYCYYTSDEGICAMKSKDLACWEHLPVVMHNPERPGAESCSVHRVGSKWVLWLNDYYHCDDIDGDFRAVYIFSDDPLSFNCEEAVSFSFEYKHQTPYGPGDWIEKRPIPVSIEVVAKGPTCWLVCYFRWHNGKFRLFFGRLDWSTSPATITEITEVGLLEKTTGDVVLPR